MQQKVTVVAEGCLATGLRAPEAPGRFVAGDGLLGSKERALLLLFTLLQPESTEGLLAPD